MDRRGLITMSTSEFDRLKVIQAVADGLLMPSASVSAGAEHRNP